MREVVIPIFRVFMMRNRFMELLLKLDRYPKGSGLSSRRADRIVHTCLLRYGRLALGTEDFNIEVDDEAKAIRLSKTVSKPC